MRHNLRTCFKTGIIEPSELIHVDITIYIHTYIYIGCGIWNHKVDQLISIFQFSGLAVSHEAKLSFKPITGCAVQNHTAYASS